MPRAALLSAVCLVALACASACAPKTGKLRVDWSYAGQSCARASVIFVRFQLDGQTPELRGCSDEADKLGMTLEKIPPGPHQLKLFGLGIGGAELWTFEQDGSDIAVGQTAQLQAEFTRTAKENPLQPATPSMKLDDVPPPE